MRRLAAGLLILTLALAVGPNVRAEPVGALRQQVSDTLAADAREVRAVLLDLERFDRWFPALAEWRVLTRTVEGARVYGRQAFPWPIDDRDYVVAYTWAEDGAGVFTLHAVAQPDAEPAALPGVVRLRDMQSRWTVRPVDDGVEVTYAYEADPGGALPSWLADVGWRGRTSAVIEGLAAEVTARRHPE